MGRYGVRDIDRGWGRLIDQIRYFEKNAVDVGIQAGEDAENGFDMAALAAVHEFGAYINMKPRHQNLYWKVQRNGQVKRGFARKAKSNFMTRHQVRGYTIKIPSRPFMRRTFDTGKAEINDFIQQVVKRVYSMAITGQRAYQLIGTKYEAMVKRKLTEGPWKPNAPATIRRKRSSRPLIDAGRLRRSIRYVVRRRV